MQASMFDADGGVSPGTQASTSSSPTEDGQLGAYTEFFGYDDAMELGLDPDASFTELRARLTADSSGDVPPHVNNNYNHDSAPAARLPQFDPASLLNPRSSSASKRPASSGNDTDRGRANPINAGQVSLVERLHNVQERTASPAKRVKTDEERRKTANSSTFGGNSALELQNPNGQVPVQQGPAIDLTMSEYFSGRHDQHGSNQISGDDDDLQCVGDNLEDTICVGKVKQTYIQAHTVPFPDPKKYLGNSGQQGRIKVAFRRTGSNRNLAIMVTDPTGKEFGRVDMKSANGLCPLMDSAKINGMMWMAWTDPRRKQAGEGPPGTTFSGLISMTLQLYCKRRWAHDIGKYLKNKNIFLIRPMFELQRYDYFNPQDGDFLTRNQAANPGFQADQFTPQMPVPGAMSNNYVLRSVDEIRADVKDVFDTVVSGSEEVPTREPSIHVKTGLYPHQKQALYFMWDKEQDHSSVEHDERKDVLWKPKYRDNGRKSYVHVITGEETAVRPKACRGGILADEMGLGKTLSILSLVSDTDSMMAAREFASKTPPLLAPGSNMLQPRINSKATLLICPLSTMTNWKEQINEHFPAGRSMLKWTRYHGSERFNMDAKQLAEYDIVITTYHIISKDIGDKKRPLPWINWFRIVLDEAHTIRNPTRQSRSTCALFGQRRWAVTGTPVQNRLEDLGALFNFIKLAPFDTTAGFNQYIVSPFKNADPEVVPKLQLLVKTVTMRRTKEIIKDKVPKRNDLIVKLEFSREERRLHDWFEHDTQRKVNIATSGEKMGGNTYARILTAILNMRLICAHGRDLLSDEALKMTDGMSYEQPMEINEDEVETSALTRSQAYDMLDLLNQTDSDECVFCAESAGMKRSILAMDSDDEDDDGDISDTLGYMTSCYHIVCPKHLKKLRQQWKESVLPDGRIQCQICEDKNMPRAFELKRADFRDYQDERERIRNDPKLAKKIGKYNGPHTKTQALLNDLEEHRVWSNEHPEERPIKR
jgi:hypothetical protein